MSESALAAGMPRLAAYRNIRLAALGVALWLGFALGLHGILPSGVLDGGLPRILAYALSLPLGLGLLPLAYRVSGLGPAQAMACFTCVASAALLCDGVAFAWFPGLYSTDPARALHAAGYLLWGVGVCGVIAMAQQHPGAAR